MDVIEKKPTAYKDNEWQDNGSSESLSYSDWCERENIWLLWDGQFFANTPHQHGEHLEHHCPALALPLYSDGPAINSKWSLAPHSAISQISQF